MKIVFLDAATMGNAPGMEEFSKLGEYTEFPLTAINERIDRVKDATVVITCKVLIDKEVMDASPELKLICVAATGINNVDMDYAAKKGIQVKNVSGYSTESVAQTTVGMILHLTNRIAYFDNYVKSGKYASGQMFTHYGPEFNELKGKTLGIIGLGNIGKRVAEIMSAFGMEICYYSTSGKNVNNIYKSLPINDLLKESDVISIHCPLNEHTKNLITSRELKLMKNTAILINAGRGGIVNETDLVEALNANLIAGTGTDVYEKEPISMESPFYQLKFPERVILTPHIAWTSKEARKILIRGIIDNIKSSQI